MNASALSRRLPTTNVAVALPLARRAFPHYSLHHQIPHNCKTSTKAVVDRSSASSSTSSKRDVLFAGGAALVAGAALALHPAPASAATTLSPVTDKVRRPSSEVAVRS